MLGLRFIKLMVVGEVKVVYMVFVGDGKGEVSVIEGILEFYVVSVFFGF